MSGEPSWICEKNGKQFGPFTSKQLIELVRQGKLKLTDRVRRSDATDWMLVGQSKKLVASAKLNKNTEDPKKTIEQIAISPKIVQAIDRWSGNFWRLTLPPKLGSSSEIKTCADEGAKVISMGMYMAHRHAQLVDLPYDGIGDSTHLVRLPDTLWALGAEFPDGFEQKEAENLYYPTGKVKKCGGCSGQGRITCHRCLGRVRYREYSYLTSREEERVCNCGDGRQNCPKCSGYGQVKKALEIVTKFEFEEKQTKEYHGQLPNNLLMGSKGTIVYDYIAEFEKQAIADAIDGFEPDEFERLMRTVQEELHRDVEKRAAGQLVNPKILHELISDYFRELPNPVNSTERLQHEILPIRLKCQITNVPVNRVQYEYKQQPYSLFVYGEDGKVWPDGKQPLQFTWKLATLLIILCVVFAWFIYKANEMKLKKEGPNLGRGSSVSSLA